MLSLEPPKHDALEWNKWDETITDMLNCKSVLVFPNLSQMKKESEMKKIAEREVKLRKRLQSREAWNRQAQIILEKQTHSMQQKVLHGKGKFGGSIIGEVLKHIPNYHGCNTITRGE